MNFHTLSVGDNVYTESVLQNKSRQRNAYTISSFEGDCALCVDLKTKELKKIRKVLLVLY